MVDDVSVGRPNSLYWTCDQPQKRRKNNDVGSKHPKKNFSSRRSRVHQRRHAGNYRVESRVLSRSAVDISPNILVCKSRLHARVAKGSFKENTCQHSIPIKPVQVAVTGVIRKWIAAVPHVLATDKFDRYRPLRLARNRGNSGPYRGIISC